MPGWHICMIMNQLQDHQIKEIADSNRSLESTPRGFEKLLICTCFAKTWKRVVSTKYSFWTVQYVIHIHIYASYDKFSQCTVFAVEDPSQNRKNCTPKNLSPNLYIDKYSIFYVIVNCQPRGVSEIYIARLEGTKCLSSRCCISLETPIGQHLLS